MSTDNHKLQDHTKTSLPRFSPQLSLSELFIYLGGLLVAAAGVTVVTTSWESWGSLSRIAAIAVPMMVFLMSGIYLMQKKVYDSIAMALIVVGSILAPLTMGIVALETIISFEIISSGILLAISLVSLCLYLGLSRAYPHAIWTLLASVAGVAGFYFLINMFGIVSGPHERLTSWMMLIPTTTLFLLSILFHTSNTMTESRYLYVLSSSLFGAIFLRLTGAALLDFVPQLWTVVLMLFGVFYLLLGVTLERSQYKDLSQGPFIIGIFLLVISLLSLSSMGIKDWVSIPSLYKLPERQSIGWAHVISSSLILFLGMILQKMRGNQTVKISSDFILLKRFQLNETISVIGPFWLLGSLLVLSTDGSRPFLELLSVIVSIGFILGSLFNASRKFLTIGTLFLVINIFVIGGEYFQKNLSWPVILVICGILTMVLGVIIEWLWRFQATKSRT